MDSVEVSSTVRCATQTWDPFAFTFDINFAVLSVVLILLPAVLAVKDDVVVMAD